MVSPYAPPQSDPASDLLYPGHKHRGAAIWLISLFFGGSAILSFISLSMALLGWEIEDPVSRDFYAGLDTRNWIFAFSSPVSLLLACISLFRLKRSAFRLWAATLLIQISFILLVIVDNAALSAVAEEEVWTILTFSVSLYGSFLLYIWYLVRKGTLG